MEDVIAETRQAAALFDGSLEIGNHDSITLFGATAQMNLRDYSRSVSRIFISQNDELNSAIDNAVTEIEKFEAKSQSKVVSILGARNLNRHIANEYSKVAEYIEQVMVVEEK